MVDLRGLFKPKTGDTSTPNKPCAIPMLNQVKSATEAFSGVTSNLRMLGTKNVGIGFGLGRAVKPSGVVNQIQSSLVVGVTKMMMKFGMIPNLPLGLDVKPGVLNQIQSSLIVGVTKMMMKSGMIPNFPFGKARKGALQQKSIQSGTTAVDKSHISPGNKAEQATQCLGVSQLPQISSSFKSYVFKENAFDSKSGSQADEKAQNPSSNREGGGGLDDAGVSVHSENNIHHMVLKHERNIEELVEENKKLRQIVEDLKVPSSKLEASSEDLNDIPNSKGEDDIHKHNEQSEKRET